MFHYLISGVYLGLRDRRGKSEGWEVKERPSIRLPFRFMDLPRELRNIVYRELLFPRMVRGNRPEGGKRFYAIHPTILRVSKQTYRESSRVLYEETKWVLVTTSEDETGMMTNMKNKTGYPFVDVKSPLCFPRTPALSMYMSSLNENDKYQGFMLIPQKDFHVIGKLLLAFRYTSIALRFDEDAMQIPAIRENLLHYCRDFRGSHSVTIEGLNPPTVRTFRSEAFLFGSKLGSHKPFLLTF